MTRQRLYSVLCATSAGGALWAAAIAVTGGGAVALGPISISSSSLNRPLMLAAASGLIAWALSLARTPREMRESPPGRKGAFILLLAVMAVVLNLLLLAQPSPPPKVHACQFVNPIGYGLVHFLNCDSPEYLGLAKDPTLVATHTVLQGRPLSFGLPHLVAQALRIVPYIDTYGPYRPYAREFVAYLLINLTALLLAMVCFTRALEAGTGAPAGIELLASLVALSANDVTKLFFWTPHTQIFNLLMPCLAVYLSFRLLTRGAPWGPMRALLTGLGFGVSLLLYGAFAVPVLCIGAIHVLVYRRLWPAVLVCGGALLIYAGWAATSLWLLGSFHNHEVELYRQFVWIADCARVSLASCGPDAQTRMLAFFNTVTPVIVVPALLVIGCRVARYIRPGDGDPPRPAAALGQAIAFTFVTSALFMAMMGAYAPRLCWQLVPPLLLLAAMEFHALRQSHPNARMGRVNVGIAAICVAYVAILAARHGPYN